MVVSGNILGSMYLTHIAYTHKYINHKIKITMKYDDLGIKDYYLDINIQNTNTINNT